MKKLLLIACLVTIVFSGCTTYYVASTTEPLDLYPEDVRAEPMLTLPTGSVLLLKGKIRKGKRLVRFHENENWYWAPSASLNLIPGFDPKRYESGYAAYEAGSRTAGSTTGSGYDASIHTGPRGGEYYINKNGRKTYLKKGSSTGSVKHVGGRGSRGGRH